MIANISQFLRNYKQTKNKKQLQSFQVHFSSNRWSAKIRLQHFKEWRRWEREEQWWQSSLSLKLRALCPTRAEQICSSGHTSITGLKEVKSNHMMKLKDMPLAFILFNPYSKNTNVLQIIYYNLFFLKLHNSKVSTLSKLTSSPIYHSILYSVYSMVH